jgi:hypothetical protein
MYAQLGGTYIAKQNYGNKKKVVYSLGVISALSSVREKEPVFEIYKTQYNALDAKGKIGFAFSMLTVPENRHKWNFCPEFSVKFVQNDLFYYKTIVQDLNPIRGKLNLVAGTTKMIYLNCGLNLIKFLPRFKNLTFETGLTMDVQLWGNLNDVFRDYTSSYPPPGDWTSVRGFDNNLFYSIPFRTNIKIGVGKLLTVKKKTKFYTRLNIDQPIFKLPYKLSIRQNYVQLSLGYIFK